MKDGLEPIARVMDRMRISDSTWERVVTDVTDNAGARGGFDERAERLRRAAHELCGSFLSAETWQLINDLKGLPEPVLRVVVAFGQTFTGVIYTGSKGDRMRRVRLLNAVLKEAEQVSKERRAA